MKGPKDSRYYYAMKAFEDCLFIIGGEESAKNKSFNFRKNQWELKSSLGTRRRYVFSIFYSSYK